MRNCILGILFLVAALAYISCQCGCVNVTASKTFDGTETIKVSSFLSTIKNGCYTNGNGLGISVTDASPDQQTIAKLSGDVVSIATLIMTVRTNSPATNRSK